MGLWIVFQIAVTLLTCILLPKITKRILALSISDSLVVIIISIAMEWGFIC